MSHDRYYFDFVSFFVNNIREGFKRANTFYTQYKTQCVSSLCDSWYHIIGKVYNDRLKYTLTLVIVKQNYEWYNYGKLYFQYGEVFAY